MNKWIQFNQSIKQKYNSSKSIAKKLGGVINTPGEIQKNLQESLESWRQMPGGC